MEMEEFVDKIRSSISRKLLFTIAGGVCVVIVLIGILVVKPQMAAKTAFSKGLQELNSQDWDNAKKDFSTAASYSKTNYADKAEQQLQMIEPLRTSAENYQKGVKLFNSKNFGASSVLSLVISQDPNYSDAKNKLDIANSNYYKGISCFDSGNYFAAQGWLENVTKTDSGYNDAQSKLMQAYLKSARSEINSGDFQGASTDGYKALKLNPDSTEAKQIVMDTNDEVNQKRVADAQAQARADADRAKAVDATVQSPSDPNFLYPSDSSLTDELKLAGYLNVARINESAIQSMMPIPIPKLSAQLNACITNYNNLASTKSNEWLKGNYNLPRSISVDYVIEHPTAE